MKTLKRVLAIAAVVIIAGLYITTLVIAIAGGDLAGRFLTASIICTVVLPCLLYIFSWISGLSKRQ